MRTAAICLAIGVLSQGVAFAATVGTAGDDGFFTKFPTRLGPTRSHDFELIVDVNGAEYRLVLPARGKILADTETGTGQLWSFRQLETTILTGEQDGGRFEITVFPLQNRAHFGFPQPARLYTRVLRWHNRDSAREIINEPLLLGDEVTEPLMIEDIMWLENPRWLLTDVTGPRWTTDRVLFSQVVGGEQFTVTLKEFGFTDWGDLEAGQSGIPEPATFVLLLASGTTYLVWRWTRRRSRSNVLAA